MRFTGLLYCVYGDWKYYKNVKCLPNIIKISLSLKLCTFSCLTDFRHRQMMLPRIASYEFLLNDIGMFYISKRVSTNCYFVFCQFYKKCIWASLTSPVLSTFANSHTVAGDCGERLYLGFFQVHPFAVCLRLNTSFSP